MADPRSPAGDEDMAPDADEDMADAGECTGPDTVYMRTTIVTVNNAMVCCVCTMASCITDQRPQYGRGERRPRCTKCGQTGHLAHACPHVDEELQHVAAKYVATVVQITGQAIAPGNYAECATQNIAEDGVL